MKYLLLIPDGMADWSIKKIRNKTPLEYADTPNMDFLAKEGACGIAKTVPEGFEPGSDVANMTILGIDPLKYYTGRGPIEALSRDLSANLMFRCNLVYIESDIMKDHSGRKINSEEAESLFNRLNDETDGRVKFYPGKSYRGLLAINEEFEDDSIEILKTKPPHDILGEPFSEYLPKNGELSKLLVQLIEKSKKILQEEKANMIWPWGGGKMPQFPSFKKEWGLDGTMISEVDLLQGIGKGIGFEIVEVDNVTGYVNTNYKGLAKATLQSLKNTDFVALHTEGIDEAGHEGKLDEKIEGIELYDEKIVGYLLDRVELDEIKIMLLPDHPTPITLRTHVAEPIPFLIYGKKKDDVKIFSEKACRKGLFKQIDGINLMRLFLK